MPPGLSAVETIAAVREQGGLVGVPHPFDRLRGFGRKSGAQIESIAGLVDWIETYNARVIGGSANERAARFAQEHGLPGLAASDSHTVLEVGVSYNAISRRSEHARGVAGRHRSRRHAPRPGHASTSGPGRRWPR